MAKYDPGNADMFIVVFDFKVIMTLQYNTIQYNIYIYIYMIYNIYNYIYMIYLYYIIYIVKIICIYIL